MASREVRVGTTYEFRAVGLDGWENRPGKPDEGELVTVVNLHGCPRSGTLGHTYVQRADGTTALVLTNSLVDIAASVGRAHRLAAAEQRLAWIREAGIRGHRLDTAVRELVAAGGRA
jgi:hypothetical protein